MWLAEVITTTKRGYECASVAVRVEKRANKNVKIRLLFSETETAKQNQKFPFHFFFRFAVEGWGEETRGKCKEIFWFLHTRVRERVRGAHHWSSGFNSKYIRTSFNTHRQRLKYKNMSQVLDLRKKSKRITRSEKSERKLGQKEIPDLPPPPPHKEASPQISWEAPSFYFNPQKKYLSLLVIALAAGGGAMLLWNKDTLTAIFLLLSSLVLVLYSGKRPDVSKIKIDQAGIVIGENLYYYKDLKSFWIHYDPGNLKELSLESRKWYMPHIKVSIENNNPLTIRSLLVNFLAEKEHEHSLVDIIARKIGL